MSAIWITGIGLVSALGADREASWSAIRAGRHGCRQLAFDDASNCGESFGYPIPDRVTRPDSLELARDAFTEAMRDALLTPETSFDRDRVGVLVGLSKPGVARSEWPAVWPSAGASLLAREGRLGGPCLSPVAACATGLVAVLQAADLIRCGACEIAVAGAADASLHPLWLGAFRRMGVLARDPHDPPAALRPWDRGRTGFLVGEGAAILVVERDDSARSRGVSPYAEIAGGALGGDAFHMTDLNPDPETLTRLIQTSLADADMPPRAMDYVNVHGTATRVNDPLECRAIRQAFGSHADSLSCSASKAQIGHLLGAAGAAELAITCLAMRDGFVPPTIHQVDRDPACDLDCTPNVGKDRSISSALKLSLGFGGHLAAIVLRRPDSPRRRRPTP